METQGGEVQKESLVFREVGSIEDRLTEIEKTSQTLSERLSSVLREVKPTEGETAKEATPASPLEGRLRNIRNRTESNILFLHDVIARLTI